MFITFSLSNTIVKYSSHFAIRHSPQTAESSLTLPSGPRRRGVQPASAGGLARTGGQAPLPPRRPAARAVRGRPLRIAAAPRGTVLLHQVEARDPQGEQAGKIAVGKGFPAKKPAQPQEINRTLNAKRPDGNYVQALFNLARVLRIPGNDRHEFRRPHKACRVFAHDLISQPF